MARARVWRWVLILAAVLFGSSAAWCAQASKAEPPAAAAPPSAEATAKLKTLTDLLADPEVRALLAREAASPREAAAPAPPSRTMALSLAGRLQAIRQHLIALMGAVALLPDDGAMARRMVASALDDRGWWTAAAFLLGFVALGFGTEALFSLAARPARRWLLGLTLETVNERVRAVFFRLVYGTMLVAMFSLGSVGAFLLFDWTTVLKEMLLGYLIAFVIVRLCAVVGRMLLAPGAPRFRVIPVATPAASFLYWRGIALAAVAAFTWQTISLFSRFGLSPLSGELWADAAGVVMVVIGLDVVWRTPPASLSQPDEPSFVVRHSASLKIGASLLLILLWAFWVLGAFQLFWLMAFAAGLPATMMISRRSVNHILRPPGAEISSGDTLALEVVVFERGIRSIVIIGAALLFGRILHVDFGSLTTADTLTTRLERASISIVVIALIADFVWHLIKVLIDRKITQSLLRDEASMDVGHAARLQTLLPIVSNFLFALLLVLAGMMMLASAGIEIGPLIASAGVVGVAIGFGAQTLVRDIISGIFYLFDDAFRVGEYIQSGSYKGTVESFSLRSVKLRHQRGALYTVPFGILGAVQNQSRDWVVDKIVLNVPYGTDLDRVRKIIKKIGEALLEDEEIGAQILSPLKMQGVVQFGDFAIQIQTKMTTKPGDAQFLGRRKALLMINRAFVENGIGFAMPTVHVAGNGEAAVAAQKGFELIQGSKPA